MKWRCWACRVPSTHQSAEGPGPRRQVSEGRGLGIPWGSIHMLAKSDGEQSRVKNWTISTWSTPASSGPPARLAAAPGLAGHQIDKRSERDSVRPRGWLPRSCSCVQLTSTASLTSAQATTQVSLWSAWIRDAPTSTFVAFEDEVGSRFGWRPAVVPVPRPGRKLVGHIGPA